MEPTPKDRFLATLQAADHQLGGHRLEDEWRRLQAHLRAAKADIVNADNHLRHAGATLAEVIGDEHA